MCMLVVTHTHTTVVWGFVLFFSFYGEGWNVGCQASYLLSPLMSQAFLEYISQAFSCKHVYGIDCLQWHKMI